MLVDVVGDLTAGARVALAAARPLLLIGGNLEPLAAAERGGLASCGADLLVELRLEFLPLLLELADRLLQCGDPSAQLLVFLLQSLEGHPLGGSHGAPR